MGPRQHRRGIRWRLVLRVVATVAIAGVLGMVLVPATFPRRERGGKRIYNRYMKAAAFAMEEYMADFGGYTPPDSGTLCPTYMERGVAALLKANGWDRRSPEERAAVEAFYAKALDEMAEQPRSGPEPGPAGGKTRRPAE